MLIALLLGIVEGITEFLPISSTGHLILVGNAVGFTGDRAASFEVFIQLGAILVIESKKLLVTTRNLDNITSRQAIGIGLVQVVALFPGISRSAATILGGMGVGLNRETAVQYSFLAAVPVMIAAISY